MNREERIANLKAQLAYLEAEDQEPVPSGAKTGPAEDNVDAILRAFFEHDETVTVKKEAEEREAENKVNRVCPACYFRQPITNKVCDLCDAAPDRWLPSKEPYSRVGNDWEREALINIAGRYSLKQLQELRDSRWPGVGDSKERRRLLDVLIPIRRGQEPTTAQESPSKPDMHPYFDWEPIVVQLGPDAR